MESFVELYYNILCALVVFELYMLVFPYCHLHVILLSARSVMFLIAVLFMLSALVYCFQLVVRFSRLYALGYYNSMSVSSGFCFNSFLYPCFFLFSFYELITSGSMQLPICPFLVFTLIVNVSLF